MTDPRKGSDAIEINQQSSSLRSEDADTSATPKLSLSIPAPKRPTPVAAEGQRDADADLNDSRTSSSTLSSVSGLDPLPAMPSAVRGGQAISRKDDHNEDDITRGQNSLDEAAVDLDFDLDLEKMGKRIFIQKVLINTTLIGLWYFFSVCISVYNKWMFSSGQPDPDNPDAPVKVNFPFPLFTTSLHMLVQFTLASAVLLVFRRFRPTQDAVDPHNNAENAERDPNAPPKPIMTTKFYLTRIAPCSTATSLDIGLGNASLKFVTLTFFTMCKSSVLGFVLGFAIIFRLEKPSWTIGGIIGIMTVGVVLMVAGETAFHALGFILLMTASFCSGLRWSLVQILLRRNASTSNPFSSLFFLTPVMFVVLIIIALPVEGPGNIHEGFNRLAEARGLGLSLGILIFPGCLAFMMIAAEFALLMRTSVVTLSVCGIFKEVITISAASAIFGDDLTPINISGLLVTLVAIATYNILRMRRMKRKTMEKTKQLAAEEEAPMLSGRSNLENGQSTSAKMIPGNGQTSTSAVGGPDRDDALTSPLIKANDRDE